MAKTRQIFKDFALLKFYDLTDLNEQSIFERTDSLNDLHKDLSYFIDMPERISDSLFEFISTEIIVFKHYISILNDGTLKNWLYMHLNNSKSPLYVYKQAVILKLCVEAALSELKLRNYEKN